MLKSIPRIQDTIYMQIVFDHLLSRMGNRSKNAILRTEINKRILGNVLLKPTLSSSVLSLLKIPKIRFSFIAENSHNSFKFREKLIHLAAHILFRALLFPKNSPPPPLTVKRNSVRIHYEPFPIHLQSPPFHRLPSMEPFEKIHIRAHLHGSRAKPSRVDRPVQSGAFKRLANLLFNAILSLDRRPQADPSPVLRVSTCKEREKTAVLSQRAVNALRARPAQRNNTRARTWPPSSVVSSKFQTWSLDSRHAFYPPCAIGSNIYI